MKLMNSWQRQLLNMTRESALAVFTSGFNAPKQSHRHVRTIMELEYQCDTTPAVQGLECPIPHKIKVIKQGCSLLLLRGK